MNPKFKERTRNFQRDTNLKLTLEFKGTPNFQRKTDYERTPDSKTTPN